MFKFDAFDSLHRGQAIFRFGEEINAGVLRVSDVGQVDAVACRRVYGRRNARMGQLCRGPLVFMRTA